ncbi:MAG: lysophospholipid acyltransferase family protein [Pseudomonadota bacterium]
MNSPETPEQRAQRLARSRAAKQPSPLARRISLLVVRLFAALPLRPAQTIGGALGWLASWLPARERDTAAANIALCFREQDERWRRQLLRAHYVEAGRTFAETCGIWTKPGEVYLSKVRRVEGLELLDAARAAGEGVILLVPHLGNWEIAANWCTSRFPVTGLYRPGDYAEIDTLMRESRQQYMGHAVPTDASGVRAMLKTLASGGTLFILPDHEPDFSGGEFAPLFGVPALTGVLTSKFVNGRHPARALMLYAKRLPAGEGWDVIFRETDPGLRNEDLMTSLSALNRSIEALIRECPAQYQWTYKRFKRRPPGAPPVYAPSRKARASARERARRQGS